MKYNSNINNKLFIYAFLIFASSILLSIFLIKYKQSEHKIFIENEMNLLSVNGATEINNRLNSLISSTYTLSSLLKNDNYDSENFNIWAKDIHNNFPFLSSIQLAKNGIVSNVYPYKEHKKAIGHDLLKDKRRDDGAIHAIQNKALTFVGPIKLIQNNKYAIIARLPIFKDKEFWGFATSIIYVDNILKNVKEIFEDANYEFSLTGVNPDSTTPPVYNSNISYNSPIKREVDISVPNGTWILTIQPKEIKEDSNYFIYLISFIFTFLFILVIIKYEKKVNNSLLRELEMMDLMAVYLDRSPLSIIISDKNLKILEWNNKANQTFGYTKEEVLNKNILDLIVPDNIKNEVLKSIKSKNINSNNINQNITKDGELITCQWYNTPLKDSSGKVDKIMSVGIDITQKEKAQKLIEMQKQEFETIFNTTIDGIATLNKELDFTHFNDAFLKMTGFKRDELLNMSYMKLIPRDEIISTRVMLDELKEKKFIRNFEKNYLLKDTKEISVNTSLSLLPDGENILISTKDITQLKQLESKSKLADMGELIANIAHQWRQPLGVISTGATGMMLQKEYGKLTDEMFYHTCTQIDENAQYLSRTIDDFRNFVIGNSLLENFILKQSIDKFLNMVDGVTKDHYINIITNIDEKIRINGYPNQLNQCMINIFNNSKDALRKIEHSDRYIFIDQSIHNDTLILKIKDTGGGIDKDIIKKIFEPYFTTKHKSNGTGLGLTITYKLITEAMNGDIKAQNVQFGYKNKTYNGVEFTISLPIN